MDESIRLQNEFENIIEELNNLKSTNETLNEYRDKLVKAIEGYDLVNEGFKSCVNDTRGLVKKIDDFISVYQNQIKTQVEGLNSEMENLQEVIKNLNFDGVLQRIHEHDKSISQELHIVSQKIEDIKSGNSNIDSELKTFNHQLIKQSNRLNSIESKLTSMETILIQQNKGSKTRFYIGLAIFIACWILLMLLNN